MFCEPAGKRARQAERTDHGQEDQLPAVLPNPSNIGIVAMLPCAASRGTGMKGALGTNGTNREIPVDRAWKT